MEIGILALWLFFWSSTAEWRIKNREKIFFVSGILSVGLLFVISLWPQSRLFVFSHEDGLIENLQVIMLLAGCIAALLVGLFLVRKQKNILFGILYFILSAGLFFVAGDEISWGQRIFNIQSSTYFLVNNAQQETTLHNLGSVNGLVEYLYIFIGFYGAFGYLFLSRIFVKKSLWFTYIVSPMSLFPYFYIGFLYNFITLLFHGHTLGVFSEPSELFLYSGISLFMVDRVLAIKK